MQTFVMATRVQSGAATSPQALQDLESKAEAKIEEECPQVEWLSNYAICGPYDYIDVFRAPDIETAQKVSMLIRTFGRAHSEVWPATEWKAFKKMLSEG